MWCVVGCMYIDVQRKWQSTKQSTNAGPAHRLPGGASAFLALCVDICVLRPRVGGGGARVLDFSLLHEGARVSQSSEFKHVATRPPKPPPAATPKPRCPNHTGPPRPRDPRPQTSPPMHFLSLPKHLTKPKLLDLLASAAALFPEAPVHATLCRVLLCPSPPHSSPRPTPLPPHTGHRGTQMID